MLDIIKNLSYTNMEESLGSTFQSQMFEKEPTEVSSVRRIQRLEMLKGGQI